MHLLGRVLRVVKRRDDGVGAGAGRRVGGAVIGDGDAVEIDGCRADGNGPRCPVVGLLERLEGERRRGRCDGQLGGADDAVEGG